MHKYKRVAFCFFFLFFLEPFNEAFIDFLPHDTNLILSLPIRHIKLRDALYTLYRVIIAISYIQISD